MPDFKISEQDKRNNFNKNEEPDIDLAFQKSEDDLLLEGLNRTYTERFYFATRLYKVQKLMEKARVTHGPNI